MMDVETTPRRHVLLFDGTWNDIDSDTNISKIKDALALKGADGWVQEPKYLVGVGVNLLEKFRGGMFGYHLSDKVVEGYEHLVDAYRPGDEVFIFGFSRGAFTALMLVGFCYWCGLRRPHADLDVQTLWQRYRDATLGCHEQEREECLARPELVQRLEQGFPLSREARARVEATQRLPIKFVGVFDTVRSAGFEALYPRKFRGVGPETVLNKHGTLVCRYTRHLPDIVESGYQALAIDEYRAAFAERVWIVPKGKDGTDRAPYLPAHAEQRWFAGAHANVGGGYEGDELALIPLRWMQERAARAGLGFSSLAVPPANPRPEQVVDSHAEFGWRLYKYLSPAYFRDIQAKRIGRNGDDAPDPRVPRLNETIDESVLNMLVNSKGKGYKRLPKHLRPALEAIAAGPEGADAALARKALNTLPSD